MAQKNSRGTTKLSFDFNDIQSNDAQISKLLECKPLPESEIRELCGKAKEILSKETNV